MVFLHGNSKLNPANFGKGQGLAREKRKRKGNARILASKEKKKFNCKIRGVTLPLVEEDVDVRTLEDYDAWAGAGGWCGAKVLLLHC